LLHAALDPDASAAATALAAWAALTDLDTGVDAASFRLLPLLHANLEAHRIAHMLTPRLAGVRRHDWVDA
jgi:hypothetical protein